MMIFADLFPPPQKKQELIKGELIPIRGGGEILQK